MKKFMLRTPNFQSEITIITKQLKLSKPLHMN
jgi:hypothetical protein